MLCSVGVYGGCGTKRWGGPRSAELLNRYGSINYALLGTRIGRHCRGIKHVSPPFHSFTQITGNEMADVRNWRRIDRDASDK